MNNIRFMEIAPDQKHELRMDAQSHFGTFEVKDDATLRKKVDDLAHSTYCGDQASNASPLDPKKFVKTGSPVITNDGILSHINSGSYAKKDISSYNLNTASSWEVGMEFDYTAYSGTQTFFSIGDGGTTNRVFEITAGGPGADKLNVLFDTVTQDAYYDADADGHHATFEDGSKYSIIAGYEKESGYYLKYKKDNDNFVTYFENVRPNNALVNSAVELGVGYRFRNSTQYFRGTVNLKTVYLKVDGVPVFSGNKTGIDTIKPDNFTNNNLVISDSGLITGISDYPFGALTPSIDFANYDNWEVIFPVNFPDTTNTYFVIDNYPDYEYGQIRLYRTNENLLQWLVGSGSGWILIALGIPSPFLVNTNYWVKMGFTGSQYYLKYSTEKDGTYTNLSEYTSSTKTSSGSIQLSHGTSSADSFCPWDLLNNFQIYGNGDLVYQPCLKIPYTEGQNYVKIVDKLYRDRVKDLFEQKGYNGYYTIGEDDFTLPSNKWSDIVEHKENGLTVAEQRVDQTLTIRGACEQGVDVNLPMEFFSADSYAVFGVGTTGTNTASKFTPAADGNYIAIGKGKV